MCDFHTLVDQQAFLIQDRGFDEQSLNNSLKPGYLIERLEELFERRFLYAFHRNMPQHFILNTHGLFNHKSDKVSFKLHYQFSAKTGELRLRTIVAKLDDVQKILFLAKNSNCPKASKIYDYLAMEKKAQLARRLIKPAREPGSNRIKR